MRRASGSRRGLGACGLRTRSPLTSLAASSTGVRSRRKTVRYIEWLDRMRLPRNRKRCYLMRTARLTSRRVPTDLPRGRDWLRDHGRHRLRRQARPHPDREVIGRRCVSFACHEADADVSRSWHSRLGVTMMAELTLRSRVMYRDLYSARRLIAAGLRLCCLWPRLAFCAFGEYPILAYLRTRASWLSSDPSSARPPCRTSRAVASWRPRLGRLGRRSLDFLLRHV